MSRKAGLSDTPFGVCPEILLTPRNLCFLALAGLILIGFWTDLIQLVRFSFAQSDYSYIILIPAVSVALMVRRKDAIFREVRWDIWPGIFLIAAGLAGTALEGRFWPPGSVAGLSATTLCILIVLDGTFTLCYGVRTVQAALFPILFLTLMVPVPEPLLAAATVLLQRASYETTYLLITWCDVPVLRNGFVLSLQAGNIFIGRECSGIRSTLGLLIGAIVASHLFLQSGWKKAFLGLCVVPVSIFKNALRIVTLYWLGVHTDQRFLTGELHQRGGIPFSLLALGMLGPLLWALRKSEGRPAKVKVERRIPKGALALPTAGQILGD